MSWKQYADWAKHRPLALRLADGLGRGRGRLRLLDQLFTPPAALRKPLLKNWESHALAATWLGHATVLLRIGGRTILTDPVLGSRVGVGLGLITAGPTRQVAPALSVEQLPPIDLILISHAHFDHLDRPTLVKLKKSTPVVTAHKTADLIRDLGFRHVTELRWGEKKCVSQVRITGIKVNHWGARTFYDQFRGYNAYLLDAGGRRVLYGGDTAYQDYFRDVGRVDLAILGIGAYDPYIRAHATPEQAWTMADHVRADYLLPMHHSTFRLSHEPMNEPMERLLSVAGNDAARVVIREVGDEWFIDN